MKRNIFFALALLSTSAIFADAAADAAAAAKAAEDAATAKAAQDAAIQAAKDAKIAFDAAVKAAATAPADIAKLRTAWRNAESKAATPATGWMAKPTAAYNWVLEKSKDTYQDHPTAVIATAAVVTTVAALRYCPALQDAFLGKSCKAIENDADQI